MRAPPGWRTEHRIYTKLQQIDGIGRRKYVLGDTAPPAHIATPTITPPGNTDVIVIRQWKAAVAVRENVTASDRHTIG